MYLLDTNVVAELRKAQSPKVDRNVLAWSNSVPVSSLHLSAITVMELEMGILLVARRDPAQGTILRTWLDGHVLPTFLDRILPVDTSVARRCARLHVPDPRPDRDALIAATALVHGMTMTRNVRDFIPTGVETVNPWEE
ncbi:MAG: type II toxin-antitoxin system VapC family toxin [Candidatus Aminicenantes bacterium]|nr:type II toxin-antitoxin system VapC family toxin [Candidatus Aminicenantes bacterium]